eukprot:TRINITY_DN58578_c0_g1_i3.p1 TRINITY_DN58578_c0_g1~~TRINITY_DN58578_c0_g1_i3.p1  ORF type:complete len:281 (-),score=-9.00 TRINITY_DN58578_c0_g1_i3:164-1006(-)
MHPDASRASLGAVWFFIIVQLVFLVELIVCDNWLKQLLTHSTTASYVWLCVLVVSLFVTNACYYKVWHSSPGMHAISDVALPDDITEEEFEEGVLAKEICPECRLMRPMRTKHCYDCEVCVPKFDHHCFWIGGCVGECNHHVFWMFLLVATITLSQATILTWSAVHITSKWTFLTNCVQLLMACIMTCCVLFAGTLLGVHSYLIVTNQTTWELMKRHSLPYMRDLPHYIVPFDEGIKQNVVLTCCDAPKRPPRVWRIPEDVEDPDRNGFNWLNNRYWSCC